MRAAPRKRQRGRVAEVSILGSSDRRMLTASLHCAGSDSSWASPTDQDVYFSDFSVAITEML